jgi:ketosteroid isomerase-like protein
MDDREQLVDVSRQIADAIARRDIDALAEHLAPGFTSHTPGGAVLQHSAFLAAVAAIPGDIEFVRLEDVRIELEGGAALVSGIQHARVIVNGDTIDDRRLFVDLFVKTQERWRIRAAIDGPSPEAGGVPAASEPA